VVGPGEIGDSIGFERLEDAQDRCVAFNLGYERGLAAAGRGK
jgi:hypothetical protein